MIKLVYSMPFKMTVCATVSLIMANYLQLKFAPVAAVIAILSIQDTRKKAVDVGIKRVLACVLGQVISIMLYGVLGNSAIIFGAFLIIFIPITSRLNIEEGMIAAIVLSTHLLSTDKIDLSLIENELLIMSIGIVVASIANIFMPSLENFFDKDKKYIEDGYSIIIERMADSLITHSVSINEQKVLDDLKIKLEETKARAYKMANNSVFQSNLYYTDYINMRINQFDILTKMRVYFERFYISYEQTILISEFTRKISENIYETNNCKELLQELNCLKESFKLMTLPKTREEFENRAHLFQYLNDLEELLLMKRNFAINYLE